MKSFIRRLIVSQSLLGNIILFLLGSLHFLISLPFSFHHSNSFHENEIRAFWQPPGYIFMIVWPILYLLFIISNWNISKSTKISLSSKTDILNDSCIEALGQGLWLLIFTKNAFSTSCKCIPAGMEYYLSSPTILFLALFAIFKRLPNLWRASKIYGLLYLPYLLWINFATILNFQILYIYWTSKHS